MNNKQITEKILKEIRPDELRTSNQGMITIYSKGKGKVNLVIDKGEVICIYSKNDVKKAITITFKEKNAEIERLRKFHKEQIDAIQKKIGKDVSEL